MADNDFTTYISEIAEDVVASLESRGFFNRLESVVFVDGIVHCQHDFSHAIEILDALAYSLEDQADVLAVMRSRGGYCDCEILYNAVEESLPKEKYWKEQATKLKQQR